MNRDRENLRAGLFVVVGSALALAVIFVLADFSRFFEQKQSIKVYFQLSDGLHGLKEGAPVTLGDQSIGEVVAIRDRISTDTAGAMRVIGKVVTASIPKRYDLYQTAIVELKAPLIGSGTSLNIRSVGEGALYKGDEPIEGSVAGSAQVQELVKEAGIDRLQRQQIRSVLANVEAITATLRRDIPSITHSALEILSDVRSASTDLKATLADAREIAGNTKSRYTPWLDRIDRVTTNADQSLATVHHLFVDQDEALRDILNNIHHLTETVSQKTLAQVTQAMDDAIAAIANFKAASTEIRSVAVGQRPVLERTMANARLTSDQLKLAAIEIRRSPWRLLYEPDDQEVSTDNLYDAARSFALAAGVLDNAALSLEKLSEDGTGEDQTKINQMIEHLEAVFEKFQDAEKNFWQALSSRPGAP